MKNGIEGRNGRMVRRREKREKEKDWKRNEVKLKERKWRSKGRGRRWWRDEWRKYIRR